MSSLSLNTRPVKKSQMDEEINLQPKLQMHESEFFFSFTDLPLQFLKQGEVSCPRIPPTRLLPNP